MLMCWIDLEGKLFDFRYLEGKHDHSVQALCDYSFVCFRPRRKLPVHITDLSNADDIVCAYIPPPHDVVGSFIISISDMDGVVVSNFSCSIGACEENAATCQQEKSEDVGPVAFKRVPLNRIDETPSCIPIDTPMTTRCSISMSDSYYSPEIARQAPCSIATLELENDLNLDSPISLADGLGDVRDFKAISTTRSESTVVNSSTSQVKSRYNVVTPITTSGETVTAAKESGFPSYRKFSDEELLVQEKATSIHENIKQHILDLGYSKEETAAVKCCLTDFTKRKHPELNNFERSEIMQSYVRKDIIDTLDIEKRLSAIRASKMNKVGC